MIRKQDLDTEITIRSHRGNKKKNTQIHPDGSDHHDVILAKRRGVFGTALIMLAILALVVIL